MHPPTFILDGGLGTSLEQKYNIHFDSTTKPLWSSDLVITDQTTLTACQKDFGDVPVDVILTASYQVSVEGFQKTKTDEFPDGIPREKIPRYLDVALDIACKAKQQHGKVALSIGPYGACMIPSQEYSGKYDDSHDSLPLLESWHRDRLSLFTQIPDLRSRVSYIAFETIPRADEIIAMRKALASTPVLSGIPFWMSILSPGKDLTLPDGSNIARAVELMLDPDISCAIPWGIGINCTKAEKLEGLLSIFNDTVNKMVRDGRAQEWPALVLYPDGTKKGEVYNTETQQWEIKCEHQSQDQRSWAEVLVDARSVAEAGGKWSPYLIGGCCRATCDDIGLLRDALHRN